MNEHIPYNWDDDDMCFLDDEDEDEEDHIDRCIMCGTPIPIEGFCCEPECLEAAAGIDEDHKP